MSTRVPISETLSSCIRGWNCPTGMPDATNQLNTTRISQPTSSPDEEYEVLLREGMERLSFDQVQREQELLHGVADENELPQNTINDHLSSLQEHLNRTKKGTAYETAEQRNRDYACNRELQLAFLRANRFNPEESAKKIIKFFRYKKDLFGDECLVRDITKRDLDEDDLRLLLEGFFQFSPFRDRAGRKIHIAFPGVRTTTTVRNELRIRFYMCANSVATMADLSRGCVFVSYLVGQYSDQLNGSGLVEGTTLFFTIPVRCVGIHVCTDNRLESVSTSAVIAMMPYRLRVKIKIHYGSHTECQYLLASYGISRAALPLEGPNSDMDLNSHHAWFQQRTLKEQQQQSSSSAKASASQQRYKDVQRGRNENDVLCLGRVVKGVGNERLRSLSRRYFPAYVNASVSDRLMIVNVVIDEIHSQGGRFLKLDDAASSKKESISLEDETQNVWKELSYDEEMTKVTQLFRNLLKRQPRWSLGSSPIAASPSLTPSIASPPPPIVVDFHQPEDVLFGQNAINNPGNRRLRELVQGMADEYNRTERGKKKDIVLRLIANIQSSGGRFLMYRKDQKWEVVSDKTAQEKISKQFRNFRRKRGGVNQSDGNSKAGLT